MFLSKNSESFSNIFLLKKENKTKKHESRKKLYKIQKRFPIKKKDLCVKKSLTRQTLLNSEAGDKNPKPQTRLILIKIPTAKWDALTVNLCVPSRQKVSIVIVIF